MFKKITLLFVAVFCVASLAFATTPTGNVTISLATGACPGSNPNVIASTTLDGNGNYNTSGLLSNTQPGTYSLIASYQGDSNNNPSSACQTETINSSVSNTQTTVGCTPNPSTQGAGVGCSGSVTQQ